MRVQIQLRIIADDDSVISEDEILQLDKGDDRPWCTDQACGRTDPNLVWGQSLSENGMIT